MSNTPPNTRPFNLQDFINGKPIVCRNGFVPTDAHYFEKAKQILFTSQHECYIIRNGAVKGESHIDSKYDLFHPCEQKEGWVNKFIIENEVMFQKELTPENEGKYVKITWYE